ncbi:MAG: ABC transporter ATP-binding protein [Candidatus Binataceae bacterium]|nr:ABC transporter ATP-binding protein [Candidatus Binataceae bacterium]
MRQSLALYGEVMRRMRPYLGRLTLAIAGATAAALVEVLKPWPLKIVIDNVLRGAPLTESRLPPMSSGGLLTACCIGLVVLYGILGIITVVESYITISIGQRMVNDLRARLFEHLQRLSLSFHRRREIGDLMVRIAYDTFSIQTIAISGLFPVLSAMVLLAGMFIVMVRVDHTLTLTALAVVPLLFILIALISSRIDRLATGARVWESRLYTVAHQALAAIHVVQAFSRESDSYDEFMRSSTESLGQTLRLYIFQTIYTGAVSVLIAGGTAAVIYLGARHVMVGTLTIGELVVFTAYLASLYAPVNQIFQTWGVVETAKAGFRRCLELLEMEPEVTDRPGARILGNARGAIEFDQVVFGYDPAHPVLKGISMHIEPGERVAIVGSSGAGKSTVASLLARFYEPQAGSIRVDGFDIRDLTLESLRRSLALVLQPPLVLSSTIRANIALGRPGASEREIANAARMARLDPVVAAMPHGIDELVGQGGHSLSEGEAQRVTIARALVKNAPILIMDEPTSALDNETETLVMAAVQELMRARTTLVIAHRLSTIRDANRIVVLHNGKIEEQGTFDDLLARGGFFSYLYNLQSFSETAASGG